MRKVVKRLPRGNPSACTDKLSSFMRQFYSQNDFYRDGTLFAKFNNACGSKPKGTDESSNGHSGRQKYKNN